MIGLGGDLNHFFFYELISQLNFSALVTDIQHVRPKSTTIEKD